ncbi:MAG TPA: bifunctional UDP-N-acetylmuramoyl-tripeptide:D-alanyl-D-alanine ligase/alanine racemase [Cytophagaceae bacterium]|jgi:alanine racemase|nr:bifunctional UDP-N-acetylmuramoyl-tripeptide:D-alanyl-D-alanine ligase/alanine racemase [Cytophagaceae bacterium]
MVQASQITAIAEAKLLSFHTDNPIHYLLLDSRKIISPGNTLFFAIKGIRHNGHQFIPSLYAKGIRYFIVEETTNIDFSVLPEASIWRVSNSITALQKIVIYHRNLFQLPVIGITGSNGKTIVKEWLSQLLNRDYKIVKNPKSYNSQIGVPLSVWEINDHHTLGIFEAGISQPNEMQHLEKIIQPTIGLFTNIGPAHDEGFKNEEEKIKEKLILFKKSSIVFYRKDYPTLHEILSEANYKTFSWSTKEKADIQIVHLEKGKNSVEIKFLYLENTFRLLLPFSDEASIENCLHCICLLMYLHLPIPEIQNRINMLHPVAMRLELKEGINGCYIIDDTYNNDLSGLTMAVNFLEQQKQRTKKTIILSDLLESGVEETQLYHFIAKMLKEKGISKMIGIGQTISKNKLSFEKIPSEFYQNTTEFLSSLALRDFSNEIILVKGARVFSFEKIVHVFQQKIHGTILEINLDALAHNLNFYRSQLKSGTKIMAMVKAFAYGSGSYEVANLLQFHRVDYLAVAYADEGVSLREHGISLPVMVMNPTYQTFDKLIQYQLEPEIYSFKILNELLQYLTENNASATIHLKLDTGMRRLGFEEEDTEDLLNILASTHQLRISSIFTHLAAADEALHNDFTIGQLKKFNTMTDRIEQSLGYKTIRHALNSAGIIRFPEAQMDMVRLGIGLYGIEANGIRQSELQTVGTLKTIISQIKKIKAGESVGYSRKGIVKQDTLVATIAIGYADGFDRGFSNGIGKVLINGKICSIIGNVCMDMCMVDVTEANAVEGDEVILFGENISILELSKLINTIPYEILTNIGERVKRVFYAE